MFNYPILNKFNKNKKNKLNCIDKFFSKWYIWYCQVISGLFGRLAQLVRAPALQAGGHRFESCIAHHLSAEIAQLVEQLICNQ